MRLLAVSVDLDEIPCYAAIHGLSAPAESIHAIYDRAVDRLGSLFARLKVPATFFAIGSDMAREANAERVRQLASSGHEIANHSLSHFYDFSRRDRASVRAEIDGGADAIEKAVGSRPVGFRAPGYTITNTVFEELESAGYEYDSSVFPCPAYYGLKTVAIGAIRAQGRRSRSIVDDPRVLLAPADPYRRGQPYWQRGSGLLELPIGVTRDLAGRAPYIGTSVALSGAAGARVLSEMIVGRPVVNLELHGIDLSDAKSDGLEWLKPHQRDLARDAKFKEAALESGIRTLLRAGYEPVTLREAARRTLS